MNADAMMRALHAAPCVQVGSGQLVDLRRPDLRRVQLLDVATSLSRLPRFLGHTLGAHPYSVAQHSVHVAQLLAIGNCPAEIVLAGLLHDAHEAFIGDCPSPVKAEIGPAWRELEARLQAATFARFGVSTPVDHPDVMRADAVMLATERRDLLEPAPWSVPMASPVAWQKLEPWPASVAYARFMEEARRLRVELRREAAP